MKQKSESQRGWMTWLSGAALGSVAMYLFDPDHGRRRRALARDKLHNVTLHASGATNQAVRDFDNRLTGIQARIKKILSRGADEPDDQVVEARVRAKLGRVISHPHAIEVAVRGGHVTLSGPILADEKSMLMGIVQTISGVNSVQDKLESHQHPDGIVALQGGRERLPMRSEFLQENWTPALRGLAVLSGGALGFYGLTRRTPAAIALAAIGLAFFARGVQNKPLKQLAGIGTQVQMIDLHKSIEINAPPEYVFDTWSNYENFPYFMSHVLEVHDLGQQRSHWVVKGPAGTRVEWDAMLAEHVRPTLLAWHSEPGAAVAHAGSIRFEPTEHGTRVNVRMLYHPPAGAFGHRLAILLGRDPKRELDDDLMRMKNFVESGIRPHDAAKPTATPKSLLH